MKLLKAKVTNFASYDHLEFDFDDLGVALVHGPTGSGKSTLCDIASWILFGVTAKNGAVDEVRSWNNLNEPTSGKLQIQLANDTVTVTRIRGKTGQNDLYWDDSRGFTKRGKDLADTQRLLNEKLGLDDSAYFLGSYFCEFSPSYNFFIAKSKERQELFEKIANLDFTLKLSDGLKNTIKNNKKQQESIELEKSKLEGRIEQLTTIIDTALMRDKTWQTNQTQKISALERQHKDYEAEKAKQIAQLEVKHAAFEKDKAQKLSIIKRELLSLSVKITPEEDVNSAISKVEKRRAALLEKTCPTCGGPLNSRAVELSHKEHQELLQLKAKNDARIAEESHKQSVLISLEGSQSPFARELEALKASNTQQVILDQLAAEKTAISPFIAQIAGYRSDQESLAKKLGEVDQKLVEIQHKLSQLSLLQDVTLQMRTMLLQKSTIEVERSTNRLLETHFESPFKVKFIPDGNAMDVQIQKDGHECSYRQLSKGQRQLLKLCFGVSVMQVASARLGCHFDNLFFDESLDGLDPELKVKAFNLFTELEKNHKSVIVIDHSSELKEMFEKQLRVELIGDRSHIEEL